MAETKQLTYAYIAGLLDGEGSIGIYRKEDKRSKVSGLGIYRYDIKVTIVSTNKEVLEFVKNLFGANIYKQTGGLGLKPCWKWQIAGSFACKFLRKIIPYMRIKKLQAETVIKFEKTFVKSQYEMTEEIRVHRDNLYQEIRRVN